MKATLVLFAFFTALIAGDFKKAFSLTSKTWADKNSPESLKKLFPEIPESFEIGAIKKASPAKLFIAVDLASKGESKTASVEMVCESWPGKFDPYGDWGVVPDPILVMEYAKVVEDEKPKEPAPKAVKLAPAQVKKTQRINRKGRRSWNRSSGRLFYRMP